MTATTRGADGKLRCKWCAAAPEFLDYHDTEWGFAVSDDIKLFEKLYLQAFQSGLSWRTILAKRENFRSAFQNFDFNKIARFTQHDIDRLLNDRVLSAMAAKLKPLSTMHNVLRSLLTRKEHWLHFSGVTNRKPINSQNHRLNPHRQNQFYYQKT